MRISDLSSDVCSSDLPPLDAPGVAVIGNGNVALDVARILAKTPAEFAGSDIVAHARAALATSGVRHINIRSEERRVGKGVSVRVDLGGRRSIKKKKQKKKQETDRQSHCKTQQK